MRAARNILFAIASFALAGCINDLSQRYELRAVDLGDPDKISPPLSNSEDKVYWLVSDSEQKCSDFVNKMFAANAATGLTLDSLAGSTSALAAVFTRGAVTRPLAGASTIFTGVRSSISAEYLSSLTISHITQAIQLTYSNDMQNYLNYLKTITSSSGFNYQAEKAQIQFIHNECALAPANGTLSNAVSQPAPPSTLPAPFVYTVTAKTTAVAKLIPDFIGHFDTSPFLGAGAFAVPTQQPNQIKMQVNSGLVLTVKPNPTANSKLNASFDATTLVLTISGPATAGDTITVTANPPKPAATPQQAAPAPAPASP